MSAKIVYTAGVFDLFHVGHLNILKASKALGDKLIVGVISDEGTALYKPEYPIINQWDRMEIVENVRCVDEVILQQTTDPTLRLEVLRPHIFTHGDDWQRLIKGHETIERLGIEFVRLPYTKGISTAKLRSRIKRNSRI